MYSGFMKMVGASHASPDGIHGGHPDGRPDVAPHAQRRATASLGPGERMRHSHARAASSVGAVFEEMNMSRLVSTRPGTALIQSRARPARFSPGAPRLKPPA